MRSAEYTSTGSEDFKKNRLNGIRYVDKTKLLIPLLRGEHETTFFLRPRRFGKTLTLSMIRYFVEDTRDEKTNEENRLLFQDLAIMQAGEEYCRQMTCYPVIHLTMQTISDVAYSVAKEELWSLIGDVYAEKSYLLDSPALGKSEKDYFQRILQGIDDRGRKVTQTDYKQSLKKLTLFLRKDAGKKVVVLIDEYDVPLEKAHQHGHYSKMLNLVGSLLQNVLKANSENLQFAVVTGCLKVANEIYAGLNHPNVNTVLSPQACDAIGFTEEEVRKLLTDSGFPECMEEIRSRYEGYRFGKTVIYNPWSVIKRIEDLSAERSSPPLNYWASTSANMVIRDLAEHADADIRSKLEQLMQGKGISFALRDSIHYEDLYVDPEYMLNVMLCAGYLTAADFDGSNIHAMIPNREVRDVFEQQISAWFRQALRAFDAQKLYSALTESDVTKVECMLTEAFQSSINCCDSVESFYQKVVLALMQQNGEFVCRSSAGGQFDIVAKRRRRWDTAMLLELKTSEKETAMLSDAQGVALQAEKKAAVKELQREGYATILTFGIALCEKHCRVVQGKTFHGE